MKGAPPSFQISYSIKGRYVGINQQNTQQHADENQGSAGARHMPLFLFFQI